MKLLDELERLAKMPPSIDKAKLANALQIDKQILALIECAKLIELCHKHLGNDDCSGCDPEVNWHTPECYISNEASKLMAKLRGESEN